MIRGIGRVERQNLSLRMEMAKTRRHIFLVIGARFRTVVPGVIFGTVIVGRGAGSCAVLFYTFVLSLV